ncbi:non-seed lectin-like [Triticum dicoccoides]|uniref:Legume lectin domain-containing protein n=1 Tax=Triticum aestivum TaxID=4565 RepID=A0A3B6U5W7_WHEAT|nr:non-seed lectin-like [Triticum dicoccoides]XP_044445708.1 non-seed lectin-like [Triticum aestivum]XP_044446155.1 non-seed lectin-like [Triticum aestivum]
MGSRRRRPTATLVLASLLCLYLAPRGAFSLSFSLDFSDAGAGSSIIASGDVLISPPALELSKNSRALYRYKVPLWNGATGEAASFATAFSFQITPDKDKDSPPQQPGDRNRMAFFLGHLPSVDVPCSSSSSAGAGLAIVTVGFDAFLNHVGIDISSSNSTAPAHTTATWPGKNLTTSSVMEATVKYHNDSRTLAAALLIDGALYQANATVDLRRILPEEVAVGFSAAAFAGMHRIRSWSFGSTLPESKQEASPQPSEPPHLPISSYNHKKIALVLLFLGTITTRCVRIGFQFRFKTSPDRVTLAVLA